MPRPSARFRSDQAQPSASLRSVRNAVRLLRCFSAEQPELGVTELSRRLGLSKSTVHLLLATLVAEGLVEQSPSTGKYRLTLALFNLGVQVLPRLGLDSPHVLPAMEELGRLCNEAITLGILDQDACLFLQRVESTEALRVDIRVGTRVPLHASAIGKVLLAYLPEERREALLRRLELTHVTPTTVTDPAVLRAELERVRRQGYAIAAEEVFPGITSIAAPVWNYTGQVQAGLSIAGPIGRLDPLRYRVALQRSAGRLSRELGYQGPFPAGWGREAPPAGSS